jgi:hypothetical protein
VLKSGGEADAPRPAPLRHPGRDDERRTDMKITKASRTHRWNAGLLACGALLGCAPGLDLETSTSQQAVIDSQVPTTGAASQTQVQSNPAGSFFQQETFVELRLNHNGAAFTQDVLPLVADDFDSFTLPSMTPLSGTLGGAATLLACHTSSAHWELQMNDIHVEAPIDSHAITADFDADRKVQMDLDVPQFSLEFTLRYWSPYDVHGFYCDTLGAGSNHDVRVNVNVSGLDGSFDVTLKPGGPKVQIQSIDRFDVSVDNVSFDSSFLTTLTNLGLGIGHIFGSGCSNLTDCVNDLVEDQLSKNATFKGMIEDAINDALDRSLDAAGATHVGPSDLDYTVALTDVSSSETLDRLNTKWDLGFSSHRPDSACASGLTRTLFGETSHETTGDDLDVMVPFGEVTDLLYTIAKQGDFCAPFPWTTPSSKLSPGGTTMVAVKPVGTFALHVLSPANKLSATVPVRIESSDGNGVSSAISAELEIIVRLVPACGAGLDLQIVDVNINNATGTMTYTGPLGASVTMSATQFINSQKASAETAIKSKLPSALNLLPSMLGLQSLGRYVATGHILTDSASATIGLNVTSSDPNCD